MEQSHKQERGDSALDALEHELYNPRNKIGDGMLHKVRDSRNFDLPTSWGNNEGIIVQGKEEKGMSFGAKSLLVSFLLLVIAMSVVAWRIMSSRNVVSSANIDMTLDVSSYVEGGESVPLTFTLLNRNTAALQSAAITLEYKKGIGSQDEEEKVREKRDLGNINPNENKRQDFSVVLYGGEAEQRDLTIKLEYKVAGSNAVFSKVITTSTVLKTPQIAVHIEGPSFLSVGQNGTFVITVKNNSATTSLASVLQLTLPNTFVVASQDPKADSKGTIWSIKPLASGETTTVTIIGAISGTQGETTSMKALIGSEGDSNTSVGVVYSSQNFDIKLRSSPLNFTLALDTESGTTEKLRYGDRAVITVTYVNTSDKVLQDVSFKLSLSGDAPLLKQVDPTNGYYDSEKQTITWDTSILPELTTLAPHTSGMVRFIVPIAISGTNSPSLKINLSGVGTSEAKDDVISTLSKSWVVQGSATISAKTTYSNSPFVSTGPIPPVPNVETTYTAHMLVSAQNSLINTRVSFILPSYVTWRNVTSDTTKISYDQRSRTVTWALGNLGANTSTAVDISLLVKPSQSHVGQTPPITSGVVLEADEEISKAHIRTTISPLTTFISGENWSINPSRVVDK
jgi:uncharacterized repeat protein (TIGR01451 family)